MQSDTRLIDKIMETLNLCKILAEDKKITPIQNRGLIIDHIDQLNEVLQNAVILTESEQKTLCDIYRNDPDIFLGDLSDFLFFINREGDQ